MCRACRDLRALPEELYSRDAIRASKRISNPGCYATSTQLLVAPLLPHIRPDAWPTIFGVSGYSGAGTVAGPPAADGRPTTAPKVTPESLGGGIRPYALTDHIHEREAGRHLSALLSTGAVKVAFVPTVAPWFSGITSVLSMPLSEKVAARDVRGLYEEKYGGERLVTVRSEVPTLADVENKHGWTVGGFQVHSEGDRAVVVVRSLFFFREGRTWGANWHIDRAGWTTSSRVRPRSASR